MNACTPLLLCCALAAAAPGDPPPDKNAPAADRYAVRLAAAAAIDDTGVKAKSLLTIAVEAAEAGQDDVVKKCLAEYPKAVMLENQDLGLTDLILRLSSAGHEAEAVEAAKALPKVWRDPALEKLVAGPTTGAAAFWRACEAGDEERFGILLENPNTPLNAKDKDGETGLMKAAARGHVAVVKRLLTGATVEVWEVDKHGRTALMHAAENGQDAVVRVILNWYANRAYPRDDPFNLADDRGRTALMLAADKGHAGVVRVLLDARFVKSGEGVLLVTTAREEGPTAKSPFENPPVHRDRKDDDGKTALDLAEAGKHAGVVEMLKKDGQ
jgi:hypothetical protein